jgi:hypothetical protein
VYGPTCAHTRQGRHSTPASRRACPQAHKGPLAYTQSARDNLSRYIVNHQPTWPYGVTSLPVEALGRCIVLVGWLSQHPRPPLRAKLVGFSPCTTSPATQNSHRTDCVTLIFCDDPEPPRTSNRISKLLRLGHLAKRHNIRVAKL